MGSTHKIHTCTLGWKKHFVNTYYLAGAILLVIALPLYVTKWFSPEYYIDWTWDLCLLLGAIFMVLGFRFEKKKERSKSKS